MCIDCMYSSECPECGFQGNKNDQRGGRRTECCPKKVSSLKAKEPKTGPAVTRTAKEK